jgi:hypothetical protein
MGTRLRRRRNRRPCVAAIEVAPWIDEEATRERFGNEIDAEEQRITAALDAIDPDGHAERSIVMSGPRQALAEAQEGPISSWSVPEATG